jgi:hypothetical protein
MPSRIDRVLEPSQPRAAVKRSSRSVAPVLARPCTDSRSMPTAGVRLGCQVSALASIRSQWPLAPSVIFGSRKANRDVLRVSAKAGVVGALSAAALLVGVTLGLAACSTSSKVPTGFAAVGKIDGATVYARLEGSPPSSMTSADGGQRLALLIRRGDQTLCDAAGAASAVRAAPICNDLALTTYSYATAVIKGTEDIHRCLASAAGAAIRLEVLRTPATWPADLAVSVLDNAQGPLDLC